MGVMTWLPPAFCFFLLFHLCLPAKKRARRQCCAYRLADLSGGEVVEQEEAFYYLLSKETQIGEMHKKTNSPD